MRLAVRSEATLATPPGPVIPGISIEVEVSATTDFVKRGVDPFILLSTWPWTSGHRGCFPNIFEASARRFYTVLVVVGKASLLASSNLTEAEKGYSSFLIFACEEACKVYIVM